ncbi:hypothetical protein CERSUDRAFT_127782, partial [Gelatoporia subvermispora B]
MTLVGPSTATLRTIQDNLSQMHDGRQGDSHAHPSSQPDPPLPSTLPTLMHQPSTASIPPRASPDFNVSSATPSASPSTGHAALSAPTQPSTASISPSAFPDSIVSSSATRGSLFVPPQPYLCRAHTASTPSARSATRGSLSAPTQPYLCPGPALGGHTASIPSSASPDSDVSSATLYASPSPRPDARSATRGSPSAPTQAHPYRPAYPLPAAAMQTASVFSLPVELLSRIFQLGVLDAPAPDQAPPGPTFEVLASHVCAHWRAVAVHTSCLWTTIHFSAVPHLERARAYLARSTKQPIDIFVDSCAEADHLAGTTLFRDEFDRAFELVLPQIARGGRSRSR